MRKFAVAFATAAALLVHAAAGQADEMKVLSAGIMRSALDEIAKNFERITGDKLAITYDPAGIVKQKVQKGEPADVVVLSQPDIAALAKARKIVPDSVRVIARTGLALAVKKGTPKPDIASPAALKKTLLAAKSVAYLDPKGGFEPGVQFQRAITRLGIVKQLAGKAKLLKSGQELAAEKDAEIIVDQVPSLKQKPEYEVVGLLPAQSQNLARFTWAAGAATKAKDPSDASDFVRVLASPESAGVFKAKGFLPPK